MTSSDDRVRELVKCASQLPENAREEFLHEQCGENQALLRLVQTALDAMTDGVPTDRSDDQAPLPNSSTEFIERLATHAPKKPRYTLQGEVARGGMGAILKVWDEDLRRTLAMKVTLGNARQASCDGETPSIDERTLGRFLEEAQVTGQLDHPGIVPVHELGVDSDGQVYFTMRLVKGRTLTEIFKLAVEEKDGWSRTRALGIVLKVCEAMAYAHSKGVIHRDLKPANIMVGKFGETYVMDWGVAKVIDRHDAHDLRIATSAFTASLETERRDAREQNPDTPLVTMDGMVVGTPSYMSPEQARGRPDEIDARTDVYAVGAMLYHLIAGRMPYLPQGVFPGAHAVWRWVMEGPPRPVHELNPEVPPELEAICEKAMARAPGDRYASVVELADDLRAYVEGRVVRAYETGALAEARKWVTRNRPLAASLLGVLVIGLGSAAGITYIQAEGKRIADIERGIALDNEKEARRLKGVAEANESRARENAAEARRQRDIAVREKANVLRLSAFQRLEDLRVEAGDLLWPVHPDKIQLYKDWLEDARELIAGLDSGISEGDLGHRARLQELRERPHVKIMLERAGSPSPTDRRVSAIDLFVISESLSHSVVSEEERSTLSELTIGEVRSDRWWYGQLTKLISDIEEFAHEETGLVSGISEKHGWGINKRLELAIRLREGFASGGSYANRWKDAGHEIAASYPGFDLPVQIDLVPIGPDPESGLWEFWHVLSGDEPMRNADGKLVMEEASGLVFVLLRGGTFKMGAQSADTTEANYDRQAQSEEGPVHEVTLSPFFLSKYEMTQGQWARLAGRNPSFFQNSALAPTLLHPVEQVSSIDCVEVLMRMGLSLPSEAQWEYGARGGTETPWWTGRERYSLEEKRAANLADQAAARSGETWPEILDWPELDDGYVMHGPVGTYSANGFGLHEIHGNLWEWCLDWYDPGFYARSPEVDPVSPRKPTSNRVLRGGSFGTTAFWARSASRLNLTPSSGDNRLGLRPARAISR